MKIELKSTLGCKKYLCHGRGVDNIILMNDLNGLKVVFFGVNDTLLDHDSSERKAIEAVNIKYFPSVNQKNFQKIWKKATKKNWRTFPFVKKTLEKLTIRKIKLGIISNGNKKQQWQKIKAMGIAKYFDKALIIVSEEIGSAKPDTRIFMEAKRQANVPAKSIFYVGDSYYQDIVPARKMGWRTASMSSSGFLWSQ